MYLLRKITKRRWGQDPDLPSGSIQAEAITHDLMTTGNALSMWKSETLTERDIEDAVLAFSAASNRTDKADFVWIDDSLVRRSGLSLTARPAELKSAWLANLHLDVIHLDYVLLGRFATLVQTAFNSEFSRRFTKSRVDQIVRTAVTEGRIRYEDLPSNLQRVVST